MPSPPLSSDLSHTTETVLGLIDSQFWPKRVLEIAISPKIKPVIPTKRQKIRTVGFRGKEDSGEEERLKKIFGPLDEGISGVYDLGK